MRITRFFLLLVFAVGLAACGFRPLYEGGRSGGGVAAELSGIAIQEPDSRPGQLVRNKLLSSMRPAGTAQKDRYSLVLKPLVADSNLVGRARPGILRQRLRLTVTYALTELSTGKEVNAGTSFSAVSYDVVHEPIADLQAQSNALTRAAQEVGGDIQIRLAAFLASHGST